MNKFTENWASKNKRHRDYEDNDLTDAVGELLKSNKSKKFRKILWIELIVVGLLLILFKILS